MGKTKTQQPLKYQDPCSYQEPQSVLTHFLPSLWPICSDNEKRQKVYVAMIMQANHIFGYLTAPNCLSRMGFYYTYYAVTAQARGWDYKQMQTAAYKWPLKCPLSQPLIVSVVMIMMQLQQQGSFTPPSSTVSLPSVDFLLLTVYHIKVMFKYINITNHYESNSNSNIWLPEYWRRQIANEPSVLSVTVLHPNHLTNFASWNYSTWAANSVNNAKYDQFQPSVLTEGCLWH